MKPTCVISSGTKEGLLELCKKYFYSPNVTLNDDGSLSNAKGKMSNHLWEYRGKRFRLILKR